MAGWARLKELVRMEIVQKGEEGCAVAEYKDLIEKTEQKDEIMKIYNELQMLTPAADYPYTEPNDLEEILADAAPDRIQITAEIKKKMSKIPEEDLKNYFQGAWLGRCIACALGKPLECTPYMGGDDKAPGWKHVYNWFAGADAYPIDNYTPSDSRAREEHGLEINKWSNSLKEKIKFMESDDDIRYTVFGLIMTEEYGKDFDQWDVGKMWHRYLTYSQVCTAETQAYLNFAQVTNHGAAKPENIAESIEYTRTYLNPYREWIGAQIRVDGYAYAAAGDLDLSARMAYTDASFSHIRNGIYGAMFCAAMISAAFAEKDPKKVVTAALAYLPRKSRLYADILKAVEIAENAVSQTDLVEKIWNTFNHYHCVHTNNNAALCAASIIYGRGDFDSAITTSVLGGWDTDCNGATVGSIMGAMLGKDKIPEKWVRPLNDTLYSEIVNFHPITISECAERSFKVYKKIGGFV